MTDYGTGGGQPAGWYYAEGDPPGTHRYWDGFQWQGAPQMIGYSTQANMAPELRPQAEPGQRFIAFLIDFGILAALWMLSTMSNVLVSASSSSASSIISLVATLAYLGYGLFNWTYLQGTTGQTIGKKQQGIYLLKSDTHQPVGLGWALLRTLFHMILWTLCFVPLLIDHIMVLTADDNRRFSDNIMDMHVYKGQ